MKKTITKSKHKTAPKANHVQRVFNLIILDESGSMSNIAIQAISGLNEVAENGGYPPTQNGDIRSLFWLFSLMALQN